MAKSVTLIVEMALIIFNNMFIFGCLSHILGRIMHGPDMRDNECGINFR